MKQLFQSLSSGDCEIIDIPSPVVKPGHLLIKSNCSLISSGTERMLLDFGKANWVEKAQKQPDKVRQVLDKALTDGPTKAIEAVQSKLSEPIAVGYCNVGEVVAIGQGVSGFNLGDRVVSNGAHAELVLVPKNLCAVIPETVDDDTAVFTILASIGLQGIRLAKPTFGETFGVSGLGLIGLLTSQLLLAQGCRVIGIDPDSSKCKLAESFGLDTLNLSNNSNPLETLNNYTNGRGLDGVLVTAATNSSDPIHLSAQACRQRGRIILVGVTGLNLRRELMYKKELSFQVSCSYGPGRYDSDYEQKGQDYPIGFVRWTEQRNFEAILSAFSTSSLKSDNLISHKFNFEDSADAYDLLISKEPSLGILFNYSENVNINQNKIKLEERKSDPNNSPKNPVLGVIGAGNYAKRVLLPAFKKAGAKFEVIVATSGFGPVTVGKKFNFSSASTDLNEIFKNSLCNTVVIATRHDSHASLIEKALLEEKHVFVEKPLCLTESELKSIKKVYLPNKLLMVGFNRRFSPLIKELKNNLSKFLGPKAFVYTVNAGAIKEDHWTQDPNEGGGRLLGEACHFVDLLRHLASSPIQSLQLINAQDSKPISDTFTLQMKFEDGSIGTIHYFSNGHNSFQKERLEVFVGNAVFQLNNYRELIAWGIPSFRAKKNFVQNKGQNECVLAFLNSIQSGEPCPIPIDEIFEVQDWILKSISI
tara:strand:- start:809 stop:2914 length:2106 start_codon:yes stop_codon:yes gene_type:complete